MKNLFKSMMLVAVAAMGMVACQNEPETVIPGNENLEKATIEVIADLETTRSAFGDKDGNFYPSYWQGGEQVKAAYLETGLYGGSYVNVISSDVATVTATGSVAKFGLTFSSLPSTSGTLLIASPAESVDFDGSGYYYDDKLPGFVINVPMEQTPLKGSVDPKAHILTATYTGSFASAIKPDWKHGAAYAKMTLKNFDKEIDNVVVTIDSKNYTLSATNVVNNVFWFGCEANEAPTTVKVVVNTPDEKAYTKTLDLSKGNGQGLPFVKGQVAEFSVNMDGVDAGAVDKPLTADIIFTNVEWKSSYYNFTGDGGVYLRLYLNAEDRPNNNSIAVGTYETYEYRNSNPAKGNFSVDKYSYDGVWDKYGSTSGVNGANSKLEVSIVNGQYYIIITLETPGDKVRTYGYKGLPEGWVIPGGGEEPEPDPDPVQLTAPTNLSAIATTNTATISWNAVANASSYDVTVGTTTKNVTALTATFDGLTPDATYEVSVVAVGDGTNYTNSTAATTTVKTLAEETGGDDPDGPIVLTSAVCFGMYYDTVPLYEFRTADGNYVLKVAINREGDRILKGTYGYTTSASSLVSATGFGGGTYAGASTIDGTSWTNAIYTGSTITVVSESGNSTVHVIEFHIVTNAGNEYDFKYEGKIVDQR